MEQQVQLYEGKRNGSIPCHVLRLRTLPRSPEHLVDVALEAQSVARKAIDDGHYWGAEDNLVVIETPMGAPAATGAAMAAAVAASDESPRAALATAHLGSGRAVIVHHGGIDQEDSGIGNRLEYTVGNEIGLSPAEPK